MPSYLVTGASRGIGYGWIVHLASQRSNTVIALVRNRHATEDRLAKDGIKNVTVVSADVTDSPALAKASSEVSSVTGGELDYLIHNAAYVSEKSGFATLLDVPREELIDDLNDSLQANVIGTVNVIDAFLPLVRRGRTKKIVVTSSGMADIDLINRFDIAVASPYAVSKAAGNALVAKYHAALGKKEGVLIFSMSPGLVDTTGGKPLSEEEQKGFQAMGAQFAEYAPHFKGPISVQESVELQLKVVEKATVETYGGSFVSHFGNQQWL